MDYVFRTKLPTYQFTANIHQSLQTPGHVSVVNIAKLGHLRFNTFSPLSDPRRTVNNVLKKHYPSLKGSAALPFITQFNLFICL